MARVKNMTQGNPYTLILSFAIPLMLGNVCQQLYTVADTAIVGKFVGVEALAAVGAAAWPVWFIPGILQGLSQGMTVLPTQQFGAGDLDGMNRSNAMTLLICGAAGILLMVVGLGISESLMILLNTTEDLLPDSLAYFQNYALRDNSGDFVQCVCMFSPCHGRWTYPAHVNACGIGC